MSFSRFLHFSLQEIRSRLFANDFQLVFTNAKLPTLIYIYICIFSLLLFDCVGLNTYLSIYNIIITVNSHLFGHVFCSVRVYLLHRSIVYQRFLFLFSISLKITTFFCICTYSLCSNRCITFTSGKYCIEFFYSFTRWNEKRACFECNLVMLDRMWETI